MENKQKFVDLDSIFKQKNPRLYRLLPRFILKAIKNIIHQDDINEFIRKNGSYEGLLFVEKIIEDLHIHVNVMGEENIPIQGGCILASNHPLGGLDAVALMHVVGKKRPDLKFLVNDVLMNLENLKSLFVPVNVIGKNSLKHAHLIEETYASDQVLLIFPAGLVSRRQSNKIEDLQWKKSFITRAKKNKKSIIPIFIGGNNSKLFYSISNWRKRFGVKANIEMFLLPHELYLQRGKTINITIGKAIPHIEFDNRYNDHQWAAEIKKKVYHLTNS